MNNIKYHKNIIN